MTRLLNHTEAADYLGTTPRHILKLWERRELTIVKVGKLVRFDPQDLDEYIARQKVPAVR